MEDVELVGGAEEHIQDPDGWMPGHLAPAATVQQEIQTCAQQKEAAEEKIWQKLGKEVIICQCSKQVVWKVVEESHEDVERDSPDLGFQGMDLLVFDNSIIGKIFCSSPFQTGRIR